MLKPQFVIYRHTGEITTDRAEQSATYNNDEGKYGAGRAIDLDLQTYSTSAAASNGKVWIKVVLDRVHCVQKVMWYYGTAQLGLTWTCNNNNCDTCEGAACSDYTLTVSTEGVAPDLSPVSECRHGDTVKLERKSSSGFSVSELVAIRRQGK